MTGEQKRKWDLKRISCSQVSLNQIIAKAMILPILQEKSQMHLFTYINETG
jgi:hypothetical protein